MLHQFTYDQWGYFEQLQEGLPCLGLGDPQQPVVIGPNDNDPSGIVICFRSDMTGGGCVSCKLGPNGELLECKCIDGQENGPPEAPPTCTASGTTYPIRINSSHPGPRRDARRGLTSFCYDPAGRPTSVLSTYNGFVDQSDRKREFSYDQLGRPAETWLSVYEEFGIPTLSPLLERRFRVPSIGEAGGDGYDKDGRLLRLIDPEGIESVFSYDDIGRMVTASRNSLSVRYTYDDAHRLTKIDCNDPSAGPDMVYTYDDANRLTRIEHKNAVGSVLMQLDYYWNLDNTLWKRVETDNTITPSNVITVEFTYDARHRLVAEKRTRAGTPSVVEYDITYTYDQLGNRLTRAEAVSNTLVEYSYDTNPANRDPNNQTNNNRLLWYVEKSWDAGQQQYVGTRTVNYTYFKSGDASNISIRDAGDVDAAGKQIVHDLALYYVRNGMLALAYQTQWAEKPPAGGPWAFGTVVSGSMQAIEAREFRYESPRGRYLSRRLRVQTVQGSSPENPCFEVDPTEPAAWTDYVGDTPFTDYTVVNNGQGQLLVTTQMRHFLESEQPASGEKRYFHSDLVGSANLATNETGTPLPAGSGIAKIAYTAFGEEIALAGGAGTGKDAMPTRYRYVGGYGYESDLLVLNGKPGSQPVTLQHVGHRWYQVNIGRFVQRDPAGLMAGVNLYSYCANYPSASIDPSGLWTDDDLNAMHDYYHSRPSWTPQVPVFPGLGSGTAFVLTRRIAKGASFSLIDDTFWWTKWVVKRVGSIHSVPLRWGVKFLAWPIGFLYDYASLYIYCYRNPDFMDRWGKSLMQARYPTPPY
ncbi:MAG: RHS repeat-associated core domain-containing protein [Phycisphaerae bacterium]